MNDKNNHQNHLQGTDRMILPANVGRRVTAEVLMISIGYRIRELEKQHGSLRAASRVLQIDAAYLKRLRDGEKLNPSEAILRKLGLVRINHYERAKQRRKVQRECGRSDAKVPA